MAEEGLGKLILGKVAEALEDYLNEDDGKEEIIQGIRDNVNIADIVGELIEEDDELKEVLRKKVKALLLKNIESIESLSDLYDDEDEMHTDIRNGLDISTMVKELLEADEELRDKAKKAIKILIEDQIKDNLDSNDMPDWDEFLELIGLNEFIKEISTHDDIKKIFTEKLRKELGEYIEENLDSSDFPENINELLEIPSRVEALLKDPDFKEDVSEKMRKEIRDIISKLITGKYGDLDLGSSVMAHPEMKKVVGRQTDELLRDTQFIDGLRETIKTRLINNEKLRDDLIDKMFAAIAHGMVERFLQRP